MDTPSNKKHNILWHVGIFVISVLIYLVVMLVEDAYPFGNQCFLADDAYVQYNTMLRTLIEYIHSGDKSSILWNRGMGTDVYLNALYYLMSPFNIIVLVVGAKHVELSLIIIIVLKCSLIPVTGLYYFRHTRMLPQESRQGKLWPWICFCCSLAWGFCGYVIAYGQNLIWLDALILMPLIALAVENVSREQGYRKYTMLLALTFVFNFYYAFYICMFVFVYFLLLDRDSVRTFLSNGIRIAGLSVVSGLMSGAILIPAAMCIMKAGDTTLNDADTLSEWGDLGHYIVSFFPFKEVTNGYLYNSNSYCGTIAVIMLFVFIVSSSVRAKDKLKYGLTAAVFMLAANFLPLNYVLHGFVIPHGTGNRFAIILTFVMLMITYRMLMTITDLKIYAAVASGVLSIAVFALSFTDSSRLQIMYSYVVFLFVVVIDVIVMVLLSRRSIKAATAVMIITVLWVAEIGCNAVYNMKDKANESDMIDSIHLADWNAEYNFLMTDGQARKTALINYDYVQNSDVNWYSSMINGYYVNAFSTMGFAHFDNVECVYDGATPLTAMMYNVRYVLTNSKNTNGGYHKIHDDELYDIYEADELAGWGFMADKDIENWKVDGIVAENQSDFLRLGFGSESDIKSGEKLMDIIPWGNIERDVIQSNGMLDSYQANYGNGLTETFNFGEFQKEGIGDYEYSGISTQYHACIQIKFTAEKDIDLYVYSLDNRDQATAVYVDGKDVSSVMYTTTGQLSFGGHIKKGEKVKVSVIGGASIGETAEKQIQLYSFNTELFDKVKQYITDETLISDGFSGNTFKGHVTAKKDGVLYLAFPYSDGYTIYVDGKKAEKLLLGKGNMGVELTGGEHEITLEYHTPGLVPGIIVSVAGVIMFVFICLYDSRRKSTEDLE